MAESTANPHVKLILGKLGFSSRSKLAAWWTEHSPRESTNSLSD
jgi:hypothetical protein